MVGERERRECFRVFQSFQYISVFFSIFLRNMDPVMQKIDEAILLIVLRRQRRMRQEEERSSRRQFWVHPMVSNRFSTGYFGNIYSQLRSYPTKFFNFTRMSVPLFDDLLERLRPRLTRMDTVMRSSVSPEERMLVTLR